MCVLAFAWRPNNRWRLVVAGNRDEHHARPSRPLARWERPGHLLAGRDVVSGGTWLGVSEEGRFAVVTNVAGYGPPDPTRESRGVLVVRLLAEPATLDERLADRFNAFNVITAEGDQASFFANRPAFMRRPLAPGTYGLSNADLDAPWPKTLRLRSGVEKWLVDGTADVNELLDMLAEGRGTPLRSLVQPDLSPPFMHNPVYGTRCSTVVLIDAGGHGRIVERSYSPEAEVTGERELSFRWPY